MALKIKNISFGFSPERQIFNNLTLSLDSGKIYALMGSNGAGKTTLFNIITGFIKISKGNILFRESNITNLQPYQINRLGIGRTFQDLRLVSKLSVKKNIILAMKHNPTDNCFRALLPTNFHRDINRQLEKKADEIIEQFFLHEVQHSLAGEVSYGQQKLLTLSCCMANGAPFLLLDEPAAGVQPEYLYKITMLLKQLKNQHKTILLIEHNTDFISHVADTIFFIHNGIISTFNNIEELKADTQAMEAYV